MRNAATTKITNKEQPKLSGKGSDELLLTLHSIQRRLDGLFGSPMDRPVYSGDDLCAMMGVSPSTLKSWRTKGLIGYSRVGSKFFYSRRDIEEFLRSSHFEAYAADSADFKI